jgi:anti-sigma factor RsiW
MTSHPSDLELWVGAAEQHLSTCERCAVRLTTVAAQQQATSERLAAALGGPVALPPEVERRVAQALAGERVVALPTRPRWGRWVAGAGVAAAAVVVAGLVVPQVLGGAPLTQSGAPVSAPEMSDADGGAAGAPLAPAERGAPPLPGDVREAAEQLVGGPAGEGGSGCGAALAAELQGQVVATGPAAGREGVLVVVSTGSGTRAWWMPSCEATSTAALGVSSLP